MNPDHPRFAQWDAGYVLGALSPAERREYEEHLASCEECRRSVAELGPMPGLLARLSGERARALLDNTEAAAKGPRADLVDDILRQSRGRNVRRIRRARIWVGAAVAAAAAILLAVILVPLTLGRSDDTDSQAVALESLSDIPITAEVTFTQVGWGTRLELECRYEGEASPDAPDGRPYALYVIDDQGNRSEVSSWRALPGTTARLEAGTAVDLDDIASVEIGSLGSGRTLMRGSPSD
ncbi:zf-HC2 domain-containing protein [Salinibacterium sp. ZJ450]|uniref:zf-HC2 domain-containing protein n=1 Tax=Salinibacterium sp. ZJ450 TaxID=2708338 RepID=UPI0014226DFB|nr:zf-HC2 domain-containing protein [Salinibacterium sp. ZJ450]